MVEKESGKQATTGTRAATGQKEDFTHLQDKNKTMLIQATITEERQVTKEVSLPFHSTTGRTFYRINKNGYLLTIRLFGNDYGGITLDKRPTEKELAAVVEYQQISASEMERATAGVLEFMDSALYETMKG